VKWLKLATVCELLEKLHQVVGHFSMSRHAQQTLSKAQSEKVIP
jgi:hypothetical protein